MACRKRRQGYLSSLKVTCSYGLSSGKDHTLYCVLLWKKPHWSVAVSLVATLFCLNTLMLKCGTFYYSAILGHLIFPSKT